MRVWMVAMALALALPAHAQREKSKDERAKEDIAVHRAIAAAHEKAAKCLEAGKTEKECHAHLATECKGIAIGRYCGMRHRH
jgi:hypothetical protein